MCVVLERKKISSRQNLCKHVKKNNKHCRLVVIILTGVLTINVENMMNTYNIHTKKNLNIYSNHILNGLLLQ